MKEEPSDSSEAFDDDDQLMSSILQFAAKEEPSECDIKDEPARSAFEEEGNGAIDVPNGGSFNGSAAATSTGPGKRYKCPKCQFESGFKFNLAVHVKIHTGEKPFECERCSKRFADPSTLAKHRAFHSEVKAFACDQCPKAFALKQMLERHVNSVHSDEKPYACVECDYRTKHRSCLVTHQRKHRGDLFRCSQPGCAYSTAKRHDLEKHAATHSQLHGHACDICGHSFADRSNLLRHQQTHSKEVQGEKSHPMSKKSRQKNSKWNSTARSTLECSLLLTSDIH